MYMVTLAILLPNHSSFQDWAFCKQINTSKMILVLNALHQAKLSERLVKTTFATISLPIDCNMMPIEAPTVNKISIETVQNMKRSKFRRFCFESSKHAEIYCPLWIVDWRARNVICTFFLLVAYKQLAIQFRSGKLCEFRLNVYIFIKF